MPKINRYEWINRTNQPGTCFFCGQKKTPSRRFYFDFCTLECALWFARAMIKNGYVLVPWCGDPTKQTQEKGD